MAKCTLRIELPGDRDFVQPGEELEAIVHVECDSKIKCNGLTLTRYWKTHGKGNGDDGDKRAVELFRGEWEAGSYEYPTTIRFPSEPTSYHGKAINIDWYLKAEADVPYAFDPSAEEMILLVDPRLAQPYVAPDAWAPQPVKMECSFGGCMIPSIVGLCIAVVLVATGYVLWAVLLAVLCAGLLLGSLRAGSALKAVGLVALEVHPSSVAPGGSFHVLLEVQPESSLMVEHIDLTVTAQEKATSGSGTNKTTHTESVFELKEALASNLKLDGTRPFEQEVSFELPVTAPATFESSDNEITTTLTLTIQPAGKLALTHTHQLQVIGHSPRA
ncbi:MAG: hypothetical protein ACJA2W_003323 [Planctomycetota bacterium]|jgi:hypothetical protein